MILLLSPAKTLDFENSGSTGTSTLPYFLTEAEKLNSRLRKLSKNKLIELQFISRPLAELNYQRNQEWNVAAHETVAKQAVLAFKGDVYQGLEAEKWNESDMEFASKCIRILSGLYGVLAPNDLILPYRLEMGTGLTIGRRKNLYKFWQEKIKFYFKKRFTQDDLIVNLASNEYFKAVDAAGLKNPVLNIEFRDFTKGDFKIISFFAKKARGLMADFVVQNRIDQPEELRAFDREGYYFDAKSSTGNKFVFLRDQQK